MRQMSRSSRLPRALLPAALFVVVVAQAGCASKSAQYESQAPAWGVRGPAVASVPAPIPQEVEADGLPAQPAPVRRSRALPDDPNEPFSPNYGVVPPARKSADATSPPPPPAPATRAAPPRPAPEPRPEALPPPPAPRPTIMPQRPRFASIHD